MIIASSKIDKGFSGKLETLFQTVSCSQELLVQTILWNRVPLLPLPWCLSVALLRPHGLLGVALLGLHVLLGLPFLLGTQGVLSLIVIVIRNHEYITILLHLLLPERGNHQPLHLHLLGGSTEKSGKGWRQMHNVYFLPSDGIPGRLEKKVLLHLDQWCLNKIARLVDACASTVELRSLQLSKILILQQIKLSSQFIWSVGLSIFPYLSVFSITYNCKQSKLAQCLHDPRVGWLEREKLFYNGITFVVKRSLTFVISCEQKLTLPE